MLPTLPLAVLALLVGLFSISQQSLWMDEGAPAFKAIMPSLRDWWFLSERLGGSDAQMPVYMLTVWLWEKIAWPGEYALRCVNLPWLLLAVLSLKRVRWWPVLCLTSPFILYYTGELRPYAMQIAAGALAASAMGKVAAGAPCGDAHDPYLGLQTAAAAGLLLASSSLTSAIWALGLWVGILLLRPDWLKRMGFWTRMLPWVGGVGVMGAYYLYSLKQGHRAAGGFENGGLLSMAFGIYEMIGLLGLGPGRAELRVSPKAALSALPLLVPAFLCFAVAWIYGLRRWLAGSKPCLVWATACAVGIPLVIFAIASSVMDFRVLGRHFSPMMPALLLPLAVTLASPGAWKSPVKMVALAVLACAVLASLSLRFSARHARDDYRQATSMVLDALQNGSRVLWRADMNCTRYYASLQGGMDAVRRVQVLESHPPTSFVSTDYVFINRPDIADRLGDYRKELEKNAFRLHAKFTGFEVWKETYGE